MCPQGDPWIFGACFGVCMVVAHTQGPACGVCALWDKRGREGVCVCVWRPSGQVPPSVVPWRGRGRIPGVRRVWRPGCVPATPQPAGQPSARSSCLLYPPALPGTAAPAPARVDPFHQRWDWAPPKTAGGSPPRRLGFPGWRGEQLRASGWRGAEGDTELRRVSPRGGDGVGRADPGRGLQVEPDHLGHVAGDGQP